MPSVIVAEHQHGQISSFCTCEELLDGGGPDWEKYRAFENLIIFGVQYWCGTSNPYWTFNRRCAFCWGTLFEIFSEGRPLVCELVILSGGAFFKNFGIGLKEVLVIQLPLSSQ